MNNSVWLDNYWHEPMIYYAKGNLTYLTVILPWYIIVIHICKKNVNVYLNLAYCRHIKQQPLVSILYIMNQWLLWYSRYRGPVSTCGLSLTVPRPSWKNGKPARGHYARSARNVFSIKHYALLCLIIFQKYYYFGLYKQHYAMPLYF